MKCDLCKRRKLMPGNSLLCTLCNDAIWRLLSLPGRLLADLQYEHERAYSSQTAYGNIASQ